MTGTAAVSILVAEDNEMNREIACELLVGLGAQVTAAVNGAEAVRLFAESAPYEYDVILMDMQMPELDGCRRQLRLSAPCTGRTRPPSSSSPSPRTRLQRMSKGRAGPE